MRSSLTNFFDFRRYGHPSKATLVEYMDGEVNPREASKIRAHLDQCASCRTHLDELREGLDFFNRLTANSAPDFAVDAGLRTLASAIYDFDKNSNTVTSPATYQKVLDELSIYLGPQASARILQNCEPSSLQRERLSDTIGPVVVAFLGQHTGSAVLANVMRIWDRSQQSAA